MAVYLGQYQVGMYGLTDLSGASIVNNQNKTVNPSTSQQSITFDSGYTGLGTVTINAMPTGTAGTPTATKGTVSNHSISVTPSVTNLTGYITGSTISGTAVTVSASELVSGTKSISANGTDIDVTNYAKVDVSVPSGQSSLQSKTYNVSSAGTATVTADSGYDGLSSVSVSVPSASPFMGSSSETFVTEDGRRHWKANVFTEVNVSEGDTEGWLPDGYHQDFSFVKMAVPSNTTITPTESSQTIGGANFMMEDAVTVNAISSTYVGSGITRRLSTDLTASGATVTVPSGYYSEQATKSVATGTAGTPSASKGTVSNHSISVTPSVTNTTGYITGSTKTGTAVTVSASELVSGTLSVTSNGIKDVTNYASVSVNVPSSGITPSGNIDITAAGETDVTEYATATVPEGVFVQDAGSVGGIATVSIDSDGLISSNYFSYQIVSPVYQAGWFGTSATVGTTVSVGGSLQLTMISFPTSSGSSATSGYTSKATITPSTSAQYINIPAGYSSGGVYYKINAMASGSATGPSSLSGSSATITTGTNTITLTKTGVSTTPTVSAGYVSSATASTATVTLTASVTVDPTPTASGATVTIPAGYYSTQTTKSVTTMTLPTSASSSATSGYTKKATISRSTSTQYINIAPGYNSAGGYYEISAVANGSASAPTSISGTSATVTTGTNTLTFTKTVSVTPVVSAGYVSSGTATNSSVSLTASVTTKAAATITPGTTNQTIASGTYLTGTQTIAGDADLVGSNILSTANIFNVQGTVVVQNYYTGSSAPSSSTGSNGDLYLQS